MKYFLPLVLFLALLSACAGEDRSGEKPLAPTVGTGEAEVFGAHAALTGFMLASPNSSLRRCGFNYGNDTLRREVVAPTAAETFQAFTDSLGAGRYYAVAYAQNGVGKSFGDTIYFFIQE